MKILSAEQTRMLDAYTIAQEPIASIDLMERASSVFAEWFAKKFPLAKHKIYVCCGIGNNGGDGLAIARLLHGWKYQVVVIHCIISEHWSEDCRINRERLKKLVPILELRQGEAFPDFEQNAVVIDALFGSGLNRPVEGYWGDYIDHLNTGTAQRVAVDIPSGLFADQHAVGHIFSADYCLSFQYPKLAFFLAENQAYLKTWTYRDIGLSRAYLDTIETPYHFLTLPDIQPLLKIRQRHDHKGVFGHGLIIAGSYGKMGAAILATRAVLKVGAGLVTAYLPKCGLSILQITFPEAMVKVDVSEELISEIPDLAGYKAIGIGPGLGQAIPTIKAVENLLSTANDPLVLDADALNIIAAHPHLFALIPRNSILTPHPKEFERLFGKTQNEFERLNLLKAKAKALGVYILLKGGNTCIASPTGNCYFNTTGNPGMGTAGMGDVLTGMLVGLLAQGYSPLAACQLGVYLHGLAGDLAAEQHSQAALVASDLIAHIGAAYQILCSNKA